MVRVAYRPLLLYSENSLLKKGIFLIPPTKRFLFTVGTKLISDPIKTDRVINCDYLLDLATVLKEQFRILI